MLPWLIRPLSTAFVCLMLGTGLSNAQQPLGPNPVPLSVRDLASIKVFDASGHREDSQTSESLLAVLPLSIPNCLDKLQPTFTFDAIPEINGLRVLVDFVVNTEGRVESPLIIESSGEANEKLVLSLIQKWRFRPVSCNGRPINLELRVLFVGPRERLRHPVVD